MGDAVRTFARDRYVPVRDGIAPATRGDAYRHGIVRSAFLDLLKQDARVRVLFAGWARQAGLLPRMQAVHEALRTLGALDPLASLPRGVRAPELAQHLPPWLLLAAPPAFRRALAAALEADRALLDQMAAAAEDRQLGAVMVGEVLALLREWGTPWPWLLTELLDSYAHWVTEARLYDARAAQRLFDGPWPAAVDALPRGKVPDKDVETLQRYARWFYRVRIRGEKVRAVARDEWGKAEATARCRDVRGGVQRAEALLSIGQYQFREGVV